MNKLFTKIAKIFLGLSMAVGVGVAIGAGSQKANQASATDASLVFKNIGVDMGDTADSSNVSTVSLTPESSTDNYTFNFLNCKNYQSAALLTKGSSGGNAFISNKTPMPYNIKSITLKASSNGGSSVRYGVGFKTTEITSRYTSGSSTTAGTISAGTSKTFTCNTDNARYFDIYITNNNNGQIIDVTFTYVVPKTQIITGSTSGTVGTGVSLSTNATSSTSWNITSNTAGASLSANTGTTVTVNATQAGSVTLEISCNGYTTVTHTITFQEATADPSLLLSHSSFSKYTGESFSVTATYANLTNGFSWGTPTSENNGEISGSVTATTGSSTSGTSTFSGTVTNAGTVILPVNAPGVSNPGSVTFNITTNAVSGLDSTATVQEGKTVTLSATASAGAITWSSEDNLIATVDSSGVVTGVSAGEVEIYAATIDENVKGICVVTVTEGPTYSTGFESADGFTASSSTTYTVDGTYGPTNGKWSVHNGLLKSSGINNNTFDIRKYNGTSASPYIVMDFDITDGHSIVFDAQCGTGSGYGVEVFYSTDSGSSYTSLGETSVGTSTKSITATIASYVSKARFKIVFTGDNPSSGNRKMLLDNVEIYTMAEPTNPTISITSKDGNGIMSGVLGQSKEVTWTTDHATGLTLEWVLVDTDSIVVWETPNITFEGLGDDATLTANLKDGNTVVTSDSVTLKTLSPSLDMRVNGNSRANWTMFEEDEITITASITNEPVSSTLTIVSNDTNNDYSSFNSSTGLFSATSHTTDDPVIVTATLTYNSGTVATDTLNITINALGTATLVVNPGSGKVSYKFGESLDTSGWTAIYTDRKGVESDVLSELDFGSLDFIGTKGLTATYNNTESNAVNITVSNKDASSTSGTQSEDVNSKTGTTNMSKGTEYSFDLENTLENVSTITLSLTVNVPTTSGGPYSHGITFKVYDDNSNTYTSDEVIVSCAAQSTGNLFSAIFNFDSNINITSLSYTFSTKADGSNARDRVFSYSLVTGIPNFDSRQALAWAQYFVDEIGGLCDEGGNTSASNVQSIKDKWSTLSNEYGWMEGASKDYFAEHTSNETIAKVLGMYSRIIARYGQTNFIVDSQSNVVVSAPHINPMFSIISESTNTVAIIVIISMVSVTAIGGYFFLKKRKENN